jgi:alpha-glucosidase
MKKKFLIINLLFVSIIASAGNGKTFKITSPDKSIELKVEVANKVTWSVTKNNTNVLIPSTIGLKLMNGPILGDNEKVEKCSIKNHSEIIKASIYKKSNIKNEYDEMIISFIKGWKLICRAYDDGVAYRIVLNKKGDYIVSKEYADFNFDKNYTAFVGYVNNTKGGDGQFCNSFETYYNQIKLSEYDKEKLALSPVLVSLDNGIKAVIAEADLDNYPGMYIGAGNKDNSFSAYFANYPTAFKPAGDVERNYFPTKRADYIAKLNGRCSLPWRCVAISSDDKELANSDLVYKLTTGPNIKDTDWIVPGKAAWDWWADWNIIHVDFKAGINTETYLYYIDFASKYKLDYIIIDEGWSTNSNDISGLKPNFDLQKIVDYGKQKNVGVILWATWRGITNNIDWNVKHYAQMGVKGFKVDFFDRDDQVMVKSACEIAKKCAENHLILDYHGFYKPSGINVKYPNILSCEGVRGMENSKWSTYDAPAYDVTIPYIRMLGGPMDYTPGSVNNATKGNFRGIGSQPMSMGTRTHQMAMYTVFESYIQTLADTPSNYMKEPECTEYMASVPTAFDETVALDGKVGEYIAMAKRKGDTWYVGAMTNWNSRDIVIDFSFLPSGEYTAECFIDGLNANHNANDYKKLTFDISTSQHKTFSMASGGGIAMKIYKKK